MILKHTQIKYTGDNHSSVYMCDCSTVVDRNIEAAMRPLTLKEQTVMNEIIRPSSIS